MTTEERYTRDIYDDSGDQEMWLSGRKLKNTAALLVSGTFVATYLSTQDPKLSVGAGLLALGGIKIVDSIEKTATYRHLIDRYLRP